MYNYVDPNEDHVIILPVNSEDPGWGGKDWESDTSTAVWTPSLTSYPNNSYFRVDVKGTSGSLSGYNTVVIYKLQGGVYVDTGITYTKGNAIPAPATPPVLGPGNYRFKLKNDNNDISSSYANLRVSEDLEFEISCNISSIPQSSGLPQASIYVGASCNEYVSADKLMVKRVDETVWYPSGHIFNIPNPNNGQDTHYDFTVKGDVSKTCRFTFTGN